MKLFVYIIMLFTSFGRLEMVEVKGPNDTKGEVWTKARCELEREGYLAGKETHVLYASWKSIVTPCIELDSHAIPWCKDQ